VLAVHPAWKILGVQGEQINSKAVEKLLMPGLYTPTYGGE
jgi:hypothetical protein